MYPQLQWKCPIPADDGALHCDTVLKLCFGGRVGFLTSVRKQHLCVEVQPCKHGCMGKLEDFDHLMEFWRISSKAKKPTV